MDKSIDLKVNQVVLPSVQVTDNEPDIKIGIHPISISPIQGTENEPAIKTRLPLVQIPPTQGVESEPVKKMIIPLSGKLITSEDPIIVGKNFRTLINMRYGDASPKTIGGMTKINTTALSTYPKVRNAFHFQKNYKVEL